MPRSYCSTFNKYADVDTRTVAICTKAARPAGVTMVCDVAYDF